jgi:predicted metal-dependent phosphoesterase TrpH
MIDLHTHTNQSDGTFSPQELVTEAVRVGLQSLAITDHDTFDGYDQAVEYAAQASIDLICGVELSTKYRGRSVHLLAYFLNDAPTEQFRSWVKSLTESRNRRNDALVQQLHAHDIHVTLEEVAARAGKIIARPHFAALMMEKGYVTSIQQAFDEYLEESGACFVSREEPAFEEGIMQILASDGLPVLAHPVRFSAVPAILEEELLRMQHMGLRGIEVYHSDHSDFDVKCYSALASKLGLAVTGGSDFHGSAKPRVSLGSGIERNVNVPKSILDELRRIACSLRGKPTSLEPHDGNSESA